MLDKIENKRERLGLSVAEAAGKAGLSRSGWHRIIKGERTPKLQTLQAMAEAVGLKLKVEI
jgi:transcriptional regulator with XRE-family HTH domain